MEKEEKEKFFDELFRLDQEDSGEEDQSNVGVILHQSRLALPRPDVSATTPKTSSSYFPRPDQSLLRTVSAPLPQLSASSSRQSHLAKETSFPPAVSPNSSAQVVFDTPMMGKKGSSMTAKTEAPKTTGKRKRGQSFETKPESQQIFNGLAFCRSHYSQNVVTTNCI